MSENTAVMENQAQKNVKTPEEKKVLRKMFFTSHCVFLTFNMVKMEANGFTLAMEPAIESIYKDDPEGKKEAYKSHQAFFNTHAVALSFIAGICYAMERQHKEGKVDGKSIENVKAALMGPTAGMFDSLFFNCFRIIAAGVGIGLCSQGNFFGTILFILLYGVTQSVLKYYLLNIGYTFGTSFIDKVFSSGLMGIMTKCSSIIGLMMVGAMTATMVSVPLDCTINIGETSVVLQDVLNSIFPGLLSVILLFVMVRLIKKGWKPMQLILLVFAIAFLGALIHIF
jgi:PTS system mannose-specific IID component